MDAGGDLYVFEISGLADPQTAIRVLNLFAQRGVVPSRAVMALDDDERMLDMTVEARLASTSADIVLEKIRSMILIRSGRLTRPTVR